MDYTFLSGTSLFKGMSQQELESLLNCLGYSVKKYSKDDVIYSVGDTVTSIGLVISGSVNIESDDIWGNKSILDHVNAGQVFAETYGCIPNEPLMVNAVSDSESKVLFLNTEGILGVCENSCNYHVKLIKNLLYISSQKNLNLSRKIFHTSSKSIRGRLLSYLSYQAVINKSYSFKVPFDRQQMADYLSVDRSAMSNELSKMQREGLLKYNKSNFVLNHNNELNWY